MSDLINYLDNAISSVKKLGFNNDNKSDNPIIPLLEKAAIIDPNQALVIAKVLKEGSFFNDIVRQQISSLDVSNRYITISDNFNSIKEDCKILVEQVSDGKIDLKEKLSQTWMNLSRGDIPSRFNKIKSTYLEVSASLNNQLQKEKVILDAYQDYRLALKEAQIISLDMLKKAEVKLKELANNVSESNTLIQNFNGDSSEKSSLELKRDILVRDYQNFDKTFQIIKDIADNLTIGYNTGEVVMAKHNQTYNLKERVYSKAIIFFETNESTFTVLNATINNLLGLNEGTKTLNSMEKGVNDSLDLIAELGTTTQMEAIKAGYGSTIKAESVSKLVDSIISFQEQSVSLISELRQSATDNAKEIETIVENGKLKYADLINKV